MYFWAGVSAIAGALERKVWIDQIYWKWYPNFYICLVAPPGIVSKSTTAGIAMDLLRQVPGVAFGPDIVTWQALVESFADAKKSFEYQQKMYVMSAMTLESSEFGNLLNTEDKQMVDLLVSLWDGKQGAFSKKTKNSGNDSIENPWINLISCTTPIWIRDNFPEYMIGGGLTSRMIFVYADAKAKYVAYQKEEDRERLAGISADLLEDLITISKIAGEYKLSADARLWGEAWYEWHYNNRPANLDPAHFGGYLARKQTHMHKLAMVIAAAESDELVITKDHLKVAFETITDLEPDMGRVFQRVGQSDASLHTEKLIAFIQSSGKDGVTVSEAYRHVHKFFPLMRDFDAIAGGCIKAGYIKMTSNDRLVAGVLLAENGR